MGRGDYIEACRAGQRVIVKGGACLKFARSKWVPKGARRTQIALLILSALAAVAVVAGVVHGSLLWTSVAGFAAVGLYLFSRRHAAKTIFQKAMRSDSFFTAMEFPGFIRLECSAGLKEPTEFRFGKKDLPLFLNYSSLRSFYIKRPDGTFLRGVRGKED